MEEKNINQENAKQVKEKKPCPKMKALKIILIILNVLLLTFLTIELAGILNSPDGNAKGLKIVAYLLVVLIIIGGGASIVLTAISLVGLVITAVRRTKGQNIGQLVFFIIFTILPAFIETTFYIIIKML